MDRAEALRILGVIESGDIDELRRARRRALLEKHPDHGGSREALAEVESAFACLSEPQTSTPKIPDGEQLRVRRGVDRPSFTIDVLPVEAFEALLLAAAELGDISDDDPPYRLEVRLHEPADTWVVFELVPDAGSSTVSMSVDSTVAVDIDVLRDTWVEAINALG